MSIKLQCSSCQATLKLNTNLRGKRIKCPRCKTPAVVPDANIGDEETTADSGVSVSPTNHDAKPLELDGPWIEPEAPKKQPVPKAATPPEDAASLVDDAPSETPTGPDFLDDDFQDLGDLLGDAPDDDLFSAKPASRKKKKSARAASEDDTKQDEGEAAQPKLPVSADTLKRIPLPALYGGLFALGVLLTFVTLKMFGGKNEEVVVSEGPVKIEDEGFSDTDQAAGRIKTTLSEMQQLLQAGKLRDFAIRYAPLKEVARLREAEVNDLSMPAVPRDRLLTHITKVRSAKPVIIDDGWGLELKAEEKVKAGDSAAVAGYGKNIDKALEKAIADLEEGSYSTFVERMFPESAKTQMLKNGSERSVLAQLEEGQNSILVEAMLSDLKAMRKMDPDVSGKLAVYLLDPFEPPDSFPQPTRSPRSFAPKPREIRMSLINGSWRFYDNFAEHDLEVSGKRIFRLSFERLGDSWRLSKWP